VTVFQLQSLNTSLSDRGAAIFASVPNLTNFSHKPTARLKAADSDAS
jgi:hypothetical protein